VRRSTWPMVCFVNELCVERFIYAIFPRFNEQWKNRTFGFLYKLLDITRSKMVLDK
jgi:hypothetical protein